MTKTYADPGPGPRCTRWLAAITAAAVLMGPAGARPQLPRDGRLDLSDTHPMVVTRAQSRAVERGLAWLADEQNGDGSWTAKIGYKLNNSYEYTDDRIWSWA